ncbi:hypothetical protein TREPR_3474 [Treponema primitia ZAS-2]|uniref:Uncharacterized protein n=1 Tax=Treponema primitia (strain ATCC BAA-887 / DSM 12427 / ZAS-2) TaxID=545694 RepID=F5YIZ7_TREPZ|nr:hypothetical protein [Treponema primitia]AEF83528.1 hypothetical protein TREPR_3474 [Treponema primitia ZAS-2]
METGEISDFPLETYRQLPYESKQFLKSIYRNLVLLQNSIAPKEPGQKKGVAARGTCRLKSVQAASGHREE